MAKKLVPQTRQKLKTKTVKGNNYEKS